MSSLATFGASGCGFRVSALLSPSAGGCHLGVGQDAGLDFRGENVTDEVGFTWVRPDERDPQGSEREDDVADHDDEHERTAAAGDREHGIPHAVDQDGRSEEHTSELQSLMRISYAV